MSLLVFGTVALDDVTTPCGVRKNILGGSASHFALCARLFTRVHLAGVVGEDFPGQHLRLLKNKGVNIDSLTRAPGATFHWAGEYKPEDLNTALTRATLLGVLEHYTPVLTAAQKKIPYVFLANYDPESQMKILELMDNPRFIGLDSMNLWIKIQRPALTRLMKKVHLFVANDGEARMLTGENNLILAAKQLRRMGPRYIIIKKGEHGVLFYCDDFMFGFPAYAVEKVVDPTGAGDTFAGGLMGCLSRARRLTQKTFKEAAVYATIMASFNVEGFGAARTSGLTLSDVRQRKQRFMKFFSAR